MRLKFFSIMMLTCLAMGMTLMAGGCSHNEALNQFSVPKGKAYLYRQDTSLKRIDQAANGNRDYEFFNKAYIYEELGAPSRWLRNKWTFYPTEADQGSKWEKQKIEFIFDGAVVFEIRRLPMTDKDWQEREQAMKS